jgi:hypothetical protein
MKHVLLIVLLPAATLGAWEAVKAPVDDTIWDIDFVSPSSGWAATTEGAILRYQGGTWTVNKEFPSGYFVGAVDAYDDNCAWAAVMARTGLTTMYFWDGSSWTPKDVIDDGLGALAINTANEGWGCSRTKVYHWDGSSWRAEGPSHPVGGFYDIKFYDRNYGFLVGDFYNHYRYVNGTWARVYVPFGENFMSVSIVAPDDVWAGGDVGFEYGVIGHYRGGGWRIFELRELRSVNAISMADDDFGWAAVFDRDLHGDIIYHWDGSAWHRVVCPVRHRIYDLATLSRDDAWACSTYGYFLRYRTGPGVTPTSLGRIKAIFK